MTHLLPPQMLRLFVARPPLEYVTPLKEDRDWNAPPQKRTQKEIEQRKVRPLEGVAAFLERARQEVADRGEATDVEDTTRTHAIVTQTELHREEKKRTREETQKRMREECTLAYSPRRPQKGYPRRRRPVQDAVLVAPGLHHDRARAAPRV